MATRTDRATYREVLAQPAFRTLFLTRTLGIAADTLRMVALSTLVFASTGSPLLAAVTFGIGFVPQAIGAVGFGALADRYPARALVVGGFLVEAAAAGVIAFGHPPVAATLALVGGVALFTPVATGAGNRLIAEVLEGDAYVLGRSLATVASSAAQLLGLAAGAAAVAVLSPQGALYVTAACHLVAAAWSWHGLRPATAAPGGPAPVGPAPVGPAPVGSGGARATSWAGARALLGDRRVRVLMLAQWLPPAVGTGGEALLIPYAEVRHFPTGSGGLLLACSPIGMMIGDIVVARLVAPPVRERLVLPLVALLGVPLLVFAIEPPLPLAAALLLLTGGGYAASLGLQRRFLDAVPEDRRGQAFGLLSAGLMTFQGLGPALFGLITQTTTVALAISIAGATAVLLAIALRRPLHSV
ncbi:MFS transporter [Cryptosporangium phraense]|uniref:MFS transporter n=1 Tax=Cryptosporangium phraense TaxID=2593070 RepID=A0A545AVL0_9ACTN|nr:MFS transporter [Cryptosporangium phraense]TQS45360.1 MFS transporter [Cryptosporangium phraense]